MSKKRSEENGNEKNRKASSAVAVQLGRLFSLLLNMNLLFFDRDTLDLTVVAPWSLTANAPFIE